MVFFFFFIVTADNSNTRHCYQCNSHNDSECENLHAYKPHLSTVYYKPCLLKDDSGTPFCRTTSYKCKYFRLFHILSICSIGTDILFIIHQITIYSQGRSISRKKTRRTVLRLFAITNPMLFK